MARDLWGINMNEESIRYKDNRSLPEILERLVSHLQLGNVSTCLSKSATQADFVSLENFLNIKLPIQFKELYLLANGQDINGLYVPLFFDGDIFNSIEMIKESYSDLMNWCEKNSRFSELFDTNNIWLYKNLIPVGDSRLGSLLCIDMNNLSGEIVEFYFEAYSGEKIALSIKDYLGYIEHSLSIRKFFVHYEHLMIESY